MARATPPLIHGLWCATLTPVTPDGAIDDRRFAAHVRALFAQGVDGIAPFGTTGEGQSFSCDERRNGLDALLGAGIPAARIVAATGCTALPETVALTKHAVATGCVAALVLPPFFWKGVTDDGLFAWYATLIERVGDPRLKLMLYHLPQVSAVPLSVDFVVRLATAFPGVVAGIKDSEGNWAHTAALLERAPELAVVIGHEPHLPRLMRAGGAGTICGVANVHAGLVRALLDPGVTPEDEARIAAFIAVTGRHPFLVSFKSLVADQLRDPGWVPVRAPLVALDDAQRRALRDALAAAGLSPGAAQAQTQRSNEPAHRSPHRSSVTPAKDDAMLIGIDPLLTPDLLHVLASMGHGDEIAIVDANFPAASVGRRVVALAGADGPQALAAILSVFPLDTTVTPAAFTMQPVDDPTAVPPAVAAFAAVFSDRGQADLEIGTIERHAFYERARHAFAVVRTGELRRYGNLLLVKGVVRP